MLSMCSNPETLAGGIKMNKVKTVKARNLRFIIPYS